MSSLHKFSRIICDEKIFENVSGGDGVMMELLIKI